MPPIPSGGGRPRALDPRSIKLTLAFLGDCDVVGSVDPTGPTGRDFPEHTILLATEVLSTQLSGPVVVLPPEAGQDRRTLAALRPDIARSLGRQLCEAAHQAEAAIADDA